MKKITLLLGSILSSVMLFSQIYLNEDFALPVDSITPPTGWTNVDSAGGGEVWRFDNPGNRTLNSPITSPAAIFDSDFNGFGGTVSEDAYLESPAFNAFGATSVKLTFDQYFNSYIGFDTASIEVYDGTSWVEINSTSTSSNNPQKDTFDITSLVSATTAAKVRFRWRGDYGLNWTIDNIKVFTPPANDLEIVSVINPLSSTTLGTTESITVLIDNLGSAAASNFPLTFILDSGTPVTETVPGPVPISGNLQYTFTATGDFSAPGTHTLRVYSALTGDADLTNDTLDKTITKFTGITTFPYFENFEANDGQWVTGGTSSSWQWGAPNNLIIDTAASGTNAWVTNLTGPYNASESSFIESQIFDFTSLIAPVFSAKIFWNSEFSWDGATLQSSIDGGVTWQRVGKIGDPNNWYTDSTINGLVSGLEPSGQGWTGRVSSSNGSNGWVSTKHDLTGLGGQSTVKLRFAFGSDASIADEGFAFDDVSVYEKPSNDAEMFAILSPTNGCSLGNETVVVQVVNAGITNLSNFEVGYILNNGTPVIDTVTSIILPQDTLIFTFTQTVNLSTLGNYTLKAYTSVSTDPINVNDTASKAIVNIPIFASFPYFEGFESGNGGWISGGANSSWALGVPNNTIIDTASSGTKAWVTSLDTNYNFSEASYVTSPCFDFTSLLDPVVSLDVFWNSEFSWDGAVLQSSIDGGTTWQKVGTFNDPFNWYNDNSIVGLTSGLEPSGEGWTGRTSSSNGSNGWVTSRNKLTGLAGVSGVILRVAFGSDPSIADEGFAFDNFQIYDTPAQDAEVLSILSPSNGCALSATETAVIQIVNAGTANISNFPVSIVLNNGTPITDTVTATILPLDTLVYTFTGTLNLLANTTYAIKAYSSLTADGLASNDTAYKNVTSVPLITSYPYAESFETSNGGWITDGSNNSWALGAPTGTVINSAAQGTQAWVTNLSGKANVSEESYVQSACFDFTSLTSPVVALDIWYEADNSNDGAALQFSTDGGATWSKVGAFGDPDNWYNDNTIFGLVNIIPSQEGWTGNGVNGSQGWIRAKRRLPSLAGNPGVQFRVVYGANTFTNTEGFGFDNFQVYESPAIDIKTVKITQPTVGCGLGSAETIEAIFENQGTDTLMNFDVTYAINGVNILPETITDTLLPNSTIRYAFTTLANLSNISTYTIDVYTAIPGDFDLTNDTASVTFTNIAAETLPYNQGFDVLTDGLTDFSSIKWSSINAGAYDWRAETTTTSSSNTGPSAPHNGTGTYIYSEASSGTIGDTIYLTSTCVDLTPVGGANSSTRVDYWYHMYGADVIALGLDIDSAGYWINIDTLLGQQQTANADTFRMRSIDLSAFQAQGISSFRFWTVKGTSFAGDVAIDDFRVYDTVAVDLAIDTILSPLSDCGLSATADVTVRLKNVGLSAVSNFPISYILNGGTPVVETVTSTINPGTSFNYTFTAKANVSANQNHTLSVSVNVTGDGNSSNDNLSSNVTSSFSDVIDSTGTPTKFYDFEANDGKLITYADTLTSSWKWGAPTTFYIPAAASGTKAWVTGLTTNHNANEMSYLETSCYDLSTIAASEQLFISFKAIYKTEIGADQVWMEYTTDNGNTWSKVLPSASSANFYSNTTANVWEGFSNGGVGVWIPVINDVLGLGGNSKVKFRFAFISNGSVENEGFGVDDLQINLAVSDGDDLFNGDALLSIQPNPSNGQFNVVFTNYAKGIYKIEVMNVNGQLVNAENVAVASKFQSKSMNLDNLDKGVYFVKVTNGSSVTTQKLVIK